MSIRNDRIEPQSSSFFSIQARWLFNRWQITEGAKSLEFIERQRKLNPKLIDSMKPDEVGTLVLNDFDSGFTFDLGENQWFEVDKKAGTVSGR